MIYLVVASLLLVLVAAIVFMRPRRKQKTLSSKEIAGAQAENAVSTALDICCRQDGRVYKIFQNVYIPKSDGDGTTEIDILLVHESGFYVFESKNIYGKLYGDLKSPKWVCYYGKSNQKFCNPINQNSMHIKHLEKRMALTDGRFKAFNIVVLGKNTQIITIPKNTDWYWIYDIHSLRKSFLKFVKDQPSVYSVQETESFFSSLLKYANASEKTKQQHVKNLKSKNNR